jgi:LPS export ABC transporter protein LptC
MSSIKLSVGFYSVLGFVLLSFCSCENDMEKVKLLSSKGVVPIESSSNIKILYSDSAKLQTEITAPEMNHFETENPYLEMPLGLKAVVYDDHGNVKSRISADYGINYTREQKMEVKKNVVVINEKGDQLNTEHLIRDEKTGRLLSDAFVKITTKDEIIFGTGLEANEDFTKYKIFNIKGTISINK